MNLLINSSLWQDGNGDIPPSNGVEWNGSAWIANIAGAFATEAPGVMRTNTPATAGDTVTGTLTYNITEIPEESQSLYFLVYDASTEETIYYTQIYNFGDPVPKTGTVDLDVTIPFSSVIVVGVSNASETITPNPLGGYGLYGTTTITLDSQPSSGIKRTAPQKAYETDKGWSFDGNYIPHFVILNWYFADNPVIYKGFQKVRIHGLSKGRSFLQLSVNGIEDDYVNEADGFTTPQYIDIPKAATFVVEDFKPTTNYTDTSNRGLGVQFKFEGRNTNIALPEPAHVIQVLVLQSTPDSTGKRAN